MIHKAQENGLIKGLVPEYVENGIAVLQNADDTILCMEDDVQSVENMKILLCFYEKCRGLKSISTKVKPSWFLMIVKKLLNLLT
jgi:hypothetical protein